MGHLGIQDYVLSRPTVAAGAGYRVVNLNLPRRDAQVMLLDRNVLTHELRQAAMFARANGGDLPDSAYWSQVVGSFREDPQLFALTHQCETLLGFLRANERHDRLASSLSPPPAVLPEIIPGPPPPLTGEGTLEPPGPPITPSAVPEPSSGLLLATALVLLGGLLWIRRRWTTPVRVRTVA